MIADIPTTASDVAAMIDHSLLRPELTDTEIAEGCRLALRYVAASACVRPCDTALARSLLDRSAVRVCTVVGFPHGDSTPPVKIAEAQRAMDEGAHELDMVLAIGKLRSGEHTYVEDEIRAIVEAAHARAVIVKVIFENYYLTDEQIVTACRLSEKAGADFAKTSTGYAGGGATLDNVRLMRATCGPRVAIKAAGGIRTLEQLIQFYRAGATRFGARSTAEIVEEAILRFAS